MTKEVDYEDDEFEAKRLRRSHQPRFSSFVTIAVALLMLFGAASRFGKIPEMPSLFGVDGYARDRLAREEERVRSLLNLGPVPVQPSELHPEPGRIPFDPNTLPPHRGEFDLDDARQRVPRATVSIAVPDDRLPGHANEEPEYYENDPEYDDDEPPAQPQRGPQTYVVANGDTWVKIATRTLGDGKRWQELLRANPAAKDGLRVGMQLTIPR